MARRRRKQNHRLTLEPRLDRLVVTACEPDEPRLVGLAIPYDRVDLSSLWHTTPSDQPRRTSRFWLVMDRYPRLVAQRAQRRWIRRALDERGATLRWTNPQTPRQFWRVVLNTLLCMVVYFVVICAVIAKAWYSSAPIGVFLLIALPGMIYGYPRVAGMTLSAEELALRTFRAAERRIRWDELRSVSRFLRLRPRRGRGVRLPLREPAKTPCMVALEIVLWRHTPDSMRRIEAGKPEHAVAMPWIMVFMLPAIYYGVSGLDARLLSVNPDHRPLAVITTAWIGFIFMSFVFLYLRARYSTPDRALPRLRAKRNRRKAGLATP